MTNEPLKPETQSQETNTFAHRCLYCGMEAELVWVHGHGQCSHCGINTEECCRGESCAYD